MSHIKRIFLDMDGVLCNFVGSAASLFGYTEESLLRKWKPGTYDICDVLEITEDNLWEVVGNEGEAFWAEMKTYSWANDLWDFCNSIAPTVIATSPSHSPSCASGKMMWMSKNLGKNFRDFIISPRKEMYAAEGHLLIDDSNSKIKKFRENGGMGLLFPRHWNSSHVRKECAFQFTKYVIKTINMGKGTFGLIE